MQRHHFLHESEVTRVRQKNIMAESSSTASISSEFWHRNLVDVPSFTNAFIEKMASENLPVKVTLTRGYKFFHESYIHDVEGKRLAVICIEHHCSIIIIGAFFSNPSLESGRKELNFFSFFTVKLAKEEEGITVRAKCFRSMKKNEAPHRLNVVFKRQKEVALESFGCSCAAGQGLCHHVIGLMYTLAHYQLLGLKSVPPVVSKTSKPQVNFSIKLLKKHKLPLCIFYGLTSGLHIVVSNNCKRVYLN